MPSWLDNCRDGANDIVRMHPDNSHSHLKGAQRLGRAPQPAMEQRDLFGGLGSIVGGIIHGIGNIIHGGGQHNNNGGGGGGNTHHSSPPKHNNGGGSKGSQAKPAPKPAKPAPAKPKPAAPATTKKAVNHNQAAAANVHTQPAHSSAAPQTQNENHTPTSSEPPAPPPSSRARAPETRSSSSGKSTGSSSSSADSGASSTVSAIPTDGQGTTTIDPAATSMPGTWAPGVSPGVSATSSSGGLSKGGLAAILVVLILLLLAALVFVGRRYRKKQREERTAASAWGASNYPKFDEKNKQPDAVSVDQDATMVGRPSRVVGDDRSYVTAADLGHHNYSTPAFPAGLIAHTGHSPVLSPTAPSFAAENRQRSAFSDFGRSPPTSPGPAMPSSPLTPLTGMPYDMAVLPTTPHTPTSARSDSFGAQTASGSGHSGGSSQMSAMAMEALVSQVFVPTLDDELKVSTGERIRVLNEYDDGWALCQNASGQEGMVPIECIQKLSSGPTGLQPAWRNSQRISSLSGH